MPEPQQARSAPAGAPAPAAEDTRAKYRYPESATAPIDSLPTALGQARWLHPEIPVGTKPGAPTRVYAVILEAHASAEVKKVGGQEMYDDAVRVNKQVGQIIQKLGVKEVYSDGLDKPTAESINNNAAVLKDPKTIQTMKSLEGIFGTGDPTELQKIKASFAGKVDPKIERALDSLIAFRSVEARFKADAKEKATIASAMSGGVKLLPTEDSALVEQALALSNEEVASGGPGAGGPTISKDAQGRWTIQLDDPATRKLFDARETFALDQFAKSGRQLGVAVWGAGHDFNAEIQAYNRAHPTTPIALVEITPAELASNYNILRMPPAPGLVKPK